LSIGVANWRQGDHRGAELMLKKSLGLARSVNDPRGAATCLEALAWVAGESNRPQRSAVLMGAADTWSRAVGSPALAFPFPNLVVHHDDCENRARQSMGEAAFEAARQEGRDLGFAEAIAYALGQ
jgi:non-specific serine/threonine protein kinase